ncbi:MAG: PKD domain-containing protein [Candidatus Binatia bacterium]|jgi:hypothetical protein
MDLRRAVIVIVLLLGGCGGCQHSEQTGGGGGAASGPTAAAPPLKARGKIEVAPITPAPLGRLGATPPTAVQGNIVATPILPPAGTGPGEAGAPEAGQEENEGDCIVVADADPDYGPPPLAVTFSAEAECNAGQPTFKWNFGDGSAPSTEPNPTHTYSRPGDYTASVSITGPGGSTASDEVDITVEEEEGATEPEE